MYIDNQLWVFDEGTGISGVFTIASKISPGLLLTAPLDPSPGSIITMSKKRLGTGRQSEQQLWRLIPSSDASNSMIQNYARESGLVIDVPCGKPGTPLQMMNKLDNQNQSFYIDIV